MYVLIIRYHISVDLVGLVYASVQVKDFGPNMTSLLITSCDIVKLQAENRR